MKPLAQAGSRGRWNWRKNLSLPSLRLGICVLVPLGLAAVLWVYLKREEFNQMAQGTQETAAGVYKETRSRMRGGIGVLVTQDAGTGLPEIAVVLANASPASLAGLKARDVITHADGKPLAGLAWQQAYARLQGPSWSSIDLTIQRRGTTNAFVVTVRRTSIKRLNQLIPAATPDFMIVRGTAAKQLYKL
jgi:predicted metalloprotease with PDZ domain